MMDATGKRYDDYNNYSIMVGRKFSYIKRGNKNANEVVDVARR